MTSLSWNLSKFLKFFKTHCNRAGNHQHITFPYNRESFFSFRFFFNLHSFVQSCVRFEDFFFLVIQFFYQKRFNWERDFWRDLLLCWRISWFLMLNNNKMFVMAIKWFLVLCLNLKNFLFENSNFVFEEINIPIVFTNCATNRDRVSKKKLVASR